jgi:hypothetical protein
MIMKPVFSQAKLAPKRIIFAEGEDERVLRAAQVVSTKVSPADPDRSPAPSVATRRIANMCRT